jgi:hypothetical protein
MHSRSRLKSLVTCYWSVLGVHLVCVAFVATAFGQIICQTTSNQNAQCTPPMNLHPSVNGGSCITNYDSVDDETWCETFHMCTLSLGGMDHPIDGNCNTSADGVLCDMTGGTVNFPIHSYSTACPSVTDGDVPGYCDDCSVTDLGQTGAADVCDCLDD